MQWVPEERADAYLDGLMSRDEARAFERDLASLPETAKALSVALVLREMLEALPPTRPPDGLEEKIARALALQAEAKPKQPKALFRRFRAALSATSWTVRGPVHALGGVPRNAQPMLAGLSQMRWMLGPLGAAGGEPQRVAAKKPMWRRALALAGY
jgi:anti-sigma factor RsiW